MTIITLHHLFCGNCVKLEGFVLGVGIFPRGTSAPEELRPKTNPDLKKRDAQLLLSK
jgi:hypothetical protein